ncbi:RNA 2',3'-cyclic phosphodiesterase [Virgibacillus ndiopensis]|uniref:RNA 2',3'-cyclic phosphodiesterase n=1 Tax=Virgibacillus ndiopensis TaxID=2004408 RepID=UPI000C07B3E2|nr:RNA 2',3'-cyclic phosphodiesterase [Virgibacillus ndiopensis]
MKNLPHYFIAIPIPLTLKDMFYDWQNELRQKLSYKQWPTKHDLHITLKFLGSVNETTLQALQTQLTKLEDFHPFKLNVGEVGTFGNPKSPRVLWAGVENNEFLTLLQEKVEECSSKEGFNKEQRNYHPHITLAKKWKGSTLDNSELTDMKKKYIDTIHTFTVDKVVIYQIHPTQVPKYEIVSRYLLKGGFEDGTIN